MARPRVIVNLAVAAVLALTAGALTLKLLRGKNGQEQAPQVQAQAEIKIVAAAQTLSRGALLEPQTLKYVPYYEQSIPEGSFRTMDDLRGRVLSQALSAGEPVTLSKLFPPGVSGGLEAMVSPGKRAMAVKGSPVMGMGGLIKPGARIDVYGVYGIYKDDKSSREAPVSKLILQNIPVLAVGEETEAKAQAKSGSDMYTLEVTPDEAEKLALSMDKGQLHFALRNPRDEDAVFTPGKDLLRLLVSYLDFEPKPPEDGPKAKDKGGVVIIKGANVSVTSGDAQAKPGGAPAPAAGAPPVPAPGGKR